MSDQAAEGVEIVRTFTAPPAAVFSAWTTAADFARWFGGPAVDVPLDALDYEAVAGRAWSATMVLPDGNALSWAGEFVDVVPDERLELTLTDDPASPARATMVVELAAVDGGTRMRFTQQTPGFSPEQRDATAAGWAGFFDELAAGLPSA
jgi:uncharacterized protein YndB with AHSA1/START domain